MTGVPSKQNMIISTLGTDRKEEIYKAVNPITRKSRWWRPLARERLFPSLRVRIKLVRQIIPKSKE